MIIYNSVKFKDRKSFDKNKTKKNVRAVFEEAGLIVFKDRVDVTPNKSKVSHTYSFGDLKKGIPTPTVYMRARQYLPALEFCKKRNLRIIHEMPKINWLVVELPEHTSFEKFHEIVIHSNLFYMIEQYKHVSVTSTATNYTYDQVYQLPALQCQEAWNEIALSPPPTYNIVTVVDFGLDTNHPDMVGQTFNNYDTASGTNNVLPVGNQKHGTGASSQIVAKNDGTYAIGVSPYDTKVSFVNASSDYVVQNNVFYDIFSYGLYHCMQMPNCIATSNSYLFGAHSDPAGPVQFMQEMVYDALLYGRGGNADAIPPVLGKGVLAFCANGNGPSNGGSIAPPNRPIYPASYDGVIAVTATEPYNGDFRKTFWADYGTITFCAAPGLSTPASKPNFETQLFGGTSGATPLTAGVAALIHAANPNLSANGIKEVLKNSCKKIWSYDYNIIPTLPGKSIEVGYGQVNAYSAVLYAKSGVVDPGPSLVQNLRVFVSGSSLTAINAQYTIQYTIFTTILVTTATPVTLTVFYSTDAIYAPGDVIISTFQITIPANTYAYQDSYSFTVPNTISGNYYFGINASSIPGETNLGDNTGFVSTFVIGNVTPPNLNLRAEIDIISYDEVNPNIVKVAYELENTGLTPITSFTIKKGFVGYEELEYRLEIRLETDEIRNVVDTWSNLPPINVLFDTPFKIEITSVNNTQPDDITGDNITIGYVLLNQPTP